MRKRSIASAVCCMLVSSSIAENVPLPGWAFSGSGLGSWGGSSPGPTEVYLNCFRASSGSGGVNSVAGSSNAIVIVGSNTTYRLSCMGRVTGPGGGAMVLFANGSGFSALIPTVGNNVPHTLYSVSFTTGGPTDTKVGAPLTAQFDMSSGLPGGGALGSFTNINLTTTVLRPNLQIQRTNAAQFALSWPSSFSWYVLESSISPSMSSWTTVTNPPSVVGTNMVVVLDRDDTDILFRLRQP